MYYFVTLSNGRTTIQNWDLDMTNNPAFIELSQEQITFLELNPNASINEVRTCTLNIVSTQAEILQQLKEEALSQISSLSYDTLFSFITEQQFTNAQASYLALSNEIVAVENSVYSLEQATDIIQKYNIIGKDCRDYYYVCKNLIVEANDSVSINNILGNAEIYYTDYKNAHPDWVYNLKNSL